jgi:hypothetical protein
LRNASCYEILIKKSRAWKIPPETEILIRFSHHLPKVFIRRGGKLTGALFFYTLNFSKKTGIANFEGSFFWHTYISPNFTSNSSSFNRKINYLASRNDISMKINKLFIFRGIKFRKLIKDFLTKINWNKSKAI